MDHFEPYLRKVVVEAMDQRRCLGGSDSKYGIAPRAALLTALWGDERCRKAPALLVFGSGAYVHRITVGSLVFDFSLLRFPRIWETRSTAFHTLFFQVRSV